MPTDIGLKLSHANCHSKKAHGMVLEDFENFMDASNPLDNEGNSGMPRGTMTSEGDFTKDNDPAFCRPSSDVRAISQMDKVLP